MDVLIADEKLLTTKAGTGLRFSVTLGDGEYAMTTQGFLAFRRDDGGLEIRTPKSWINFYGTTKPCFFTKITPKLAESLSASVEKSFGEGIKQSAEWSKKRAEKKKTKQILHDIQGWEPEF